MEVRDSQVEGIKFQVNQLLAESPDSKSDRKKDKRPVRMVSMDHAGFQLWQHQELNCALTQNRKTNENKGTT